MRGRRNVLFFALVAALAIIGLAGAVWAEEKPWWPFPVEDWASGKAVETGFVPIEKASKKWKLFSLIPHMKDSWWLGVTYGEVAEARRMGVELTILDAGGYPNLNQQISQYNDALAAGADAILISVVSEGGMSKSIQQGKEKGIPQIAVGNPVHKAPVDSKVYTDQVMLSYVGGKWAVEYFKDKDKVRCVQFPGPQGSGWAEEGVQGFAEGIKGSNIELLEKKFGDTGKEVQLKLVEDALQTYKDLDLLFGVAPMGEVAVKAVEEQGLKDKTKIICWYENVGVIEAVKRGDILMSITQRQVMMGRLGVALAVAALEGKPFSPELHMIPLILTQESMKTIEPTTYMPPADYKATYRVE